MTESRTIAGPQQQQRRDRVRSRSLEYGSDRLITPVALRALIQDVQASASDDGEDDQLGVERTVRLLGNRDQDRDNKDCAEQAQRLDCRVPQFLRPGVWAILIETAMNKSPASAAAALSQISANVSQPFTGLPLFVQQDP